MLSNSEEVLKPKLTVEPKRGATGSMSVKLPRLEIKSLMVTLVNGEAFRTLLKLL